MNEETETTRDFEAEEKAIAPYAEFVAELSELSRKYKVWVGGCGCCNSPFLEPEDDMYDGDVTVEYRLDAEDYVMSPENSRIRLRQITPSDIERENRIWED